MAINLYHGIIYIIFVGILLNAERVEATASISGNITVERYTDGSVELTCIIEGYDFEFLGDVSWWREVTDPESGQRSYTEQLDDWDYDYEKYMVTYPRTFTEEAQDFQLVILDFNHNDTGVYECRVYDYDDNFEEILIANQSFFLVYEEEAEEWMDTTAANNPTDIHIHTQTSHSNTHQATDTPTVTSTHGHIDTSPSTQTNILITTRRNTQRSTQRNTARSTGRNSSPSAPPPVSTVDMTHMSGETTFNNPDRTSQRVTGQTETTVSRDRQDSSVSRSTAVYSSGLLVTLLAVSQAFVTHNIATTAFQNND